MSTQNPEMLALRNTQDALFCVSVNADLLADGRDEVSLRSTA